MPSLVLPVPNEPRTTSAVSGLTLGCLMRGAQKLTNDHECDTVIKKSLAPLQATARCCG